MEETARPGKPFSYRTRIVMFVSRIILLSILIVGIVYAGDHFIDKWNADASPYADYSSSWFQAPDGGSCSVAVVALSGDLYVTHADASVYSSGDSSSTAVADDIVAQLNAAKNDDSIQGVVLTVDSLGGSAVAGEMIAHALKALGKPSVALIRESGDSAAYLASSGASRIIASAFSDVGDIGVTGSYVQSAQQDQQNGLQFIQISAGTYKDAGNPDKPITPQEKSLLQRNVDDDYQTFITEVAQNRNLASSTVKSLADGSSMTGTRALGTGLIDGLGNMDDARSWLMQKINDKSLVLCQ